MVKRKKHKRETVLYNYHSVLYFDHVRHIQTWDNTKKRYVSITVPHPGVADAERHDVVHYILRLSQDVSRLR